MEIVYLRDNFNFDIMFFEIFDLVLFYIDINGYNFYLFICLRVYFFVGVGVSGVDNRSFGRYFGYKIFVVGIVIRDGFKVFLLVDIEFVNGLGLSYRG